MNCRTLGPTTRLPSFIRNALYRAQRCRRKSFPCNRPRWRICAAATAKPMRKSSGAFWAIEERGPKRDAVLLNAAAALFIAGKTKSLVEGWDLAAEVD